MFSASKNSANSMENTQAAGEGMCKHMEGINCIWEAVPSNVQAGLTLGRVVGYIFNRTTAAQPSLEALK